MSIFRCLRYNAFADPSNRQQEKTEQSVQSSGSVIVKGKFVRTLVTSFFILICSLPLFAKSPVFALVVTANTPYVGTSFQLDSTLNIAQIQERIQKGHFPIRVAYGAHRWMILYTEAGDWFNHKILFSSSGFPLDSITTHWENGWILLDADHQGEQWLCILIQPYLKTAQRISKFAISPSTTLFDIRKHIAPQWSEGWKIRFATVDNDSLLLCWEYQPNWQQDVLLLDSFQDYPLIQRWNEGYTITAMAPLGEFFFTILTKGQNWSKQIAVLDTKASTMSSLFLSATRQAEAFTATELVAGVRTVAPPISQNNNYQRFNKVLTFVQNVATASRLTQYRQFVQDHRGEELGFRALQNYAGYYLQKGMQDSAIALYSAYATVAEWKERIAKILAVLESPSDSITIENLGPNINTQYHEFAPSITLDESRLYFGSAYRPDGLGGEDIYVAENANGSWQKAANLGEPLNTRSHEAPLAISPDGQEMLIFGNYASGIGGGDIYLAHWNGKNWSTPELLPEPINSKYFEGDACFTPDGRAIIFVSDRPVPGKATWRKNASREDGLVGGDLDLYITFRTDTGWTSPIHLGNNINTPFAERSPSFHPDGKTLYFSSSGHPGLGKLDVFKTTRLSEKDWTQWATPVNLGAEINGPDEDWGYVVTANSHYAYCALIRPEGYGGNDIYKVFLPQRARPLPVVTVRGIVQSPTGVPLSAKIKWEDLSTGEIIGVLSSDPQTGQYTIALPIGKHYGFFAEAEGYYSLSESIDLRDTARFDKTMKLTQNITLIPIEQLQAKPIELRNIFFAFNSHELLPESTPELQRLANFLKNHPHYQIEIIGHTDNVGSEAYNLELSKKRAQSVADYLIQHGVDPSRITIIGKGETEPIALNTTEEGRSQNRRVEFRLIPVR